MSPSEAGLRLDTPLLTPAALPTSDVEKPKSAYLLFREAGGRLSEEAYQALALWGSDNKVTELTFTNRFEKSGYETVGKQFESLATHAKIEITDKQIGLYQILRFPHHLYRNDPKEPHMLYSLTPRLSDRDVAADVLLATADKREYLKFIRSFDVVDIETGETRFFRKMSDHAALNRFLEARDSAKIA